MSLNGFGENGLEEFSGPGHWNDPDMLEIGNGKMSHDEYITHMSLWCLLASPLISGNNLTRMTPETLSILTNAEIIAVNQDRQGVQGHRVSQEGPLEVWVKPLANHTLVIGLFNRGESRNPVTASLAALGVFGKAAVSDLWAHRDLGTVQSFITLDVPTHGSVVLKVRSLGNQR
jgi:alpha-galactosidase